MPQQAWAVAYSVDFIALSVIAEPWFNHDTDDKPFSFTVRSLICRLPMCIIKGINALKTQGRFFSEM